MKKQIAGLLFFAAFFTVFAGCGKKAPEQLDRGTYYNSAREIMFNITPEELGLKLPKEKTVYGIVVEQNVMGFFLITSAAYITGEACEFTNTSGVVVSGAQGRNAGITKEFYGLIRKYIKFFGADIKKYFKNKTVEEITASYFLTYIVKDEEINALSKEFIQAAQLMGNFAAKVENIDFPANDTSRIYFLTNEGVFYAEESADRIASGHTPYADFFQYRNALSERIVRHMPSR